MKRAHGQGGLKRPVRLNEDPFWVNAAWGIDYETKQISGDGRAEVWEDFCNAAKTCVCSEHTVSIRRKGAVRMWFWRSVVGLPHGQKSMGISLHRHGIPVGTLHGAERAVSMS